MQHDNKTPVATNPESVQLTVCQNCENGHPCVTPECCNSPNLVSEQQIEYSAALKPANNYLRNLHLFMLANKQGETRR